MSGPSGPKLPCWLLCLPLLIQVKECKWQWLVLLLGQRSVRPHEFGKVEDLLLRTQMIQEGQNIVERPVLRHVFHAPSPLRDDDGVVGVLRVCVRLVVHHDNPLQGAAQVLQVLFSSWMLNFFGDCIMEILVLRVQTAHDVESIVHPVVGPHHQLILLANSFQKQIQPRPLICYPTFCFGIIDSGDDTTIEIHTQCRSPSQMRLPICQVTLDLHTHESGIQCLPNVLGAQPFSGRLRNRPDRASDGRIRVHDIGSHEYADGSKQGPFPMSRPIDGGVGHWGRFRNGTEATL
mmetsp:Transcript_3533/g.6765  ORF Transcript_3533/g.6765 Transcript_3533/m.6765 type:complete len:291 (-) Transcript_3533:74-946(-)